MMRQRNVSSHDEEPEQISTTTRLINRVRALDVVYPKAEEDALTHTKEGAYLSIAVVVLSLLLFTAELYNYLSVQYVHSIAVDTRPSHRIPIMFNISFPHLQCSLTSIDVMDVSGEVQVDAAKNVWRTRLTREGQKIGLPFEDLHVAGGAEHRMDRRGEGCFISATLQVQKVAGNVHIALGSSHAHEQGSDPNHPPSTKHMHSFHPAEIGQFDASHSITTFSFGPLVPTITNPLDDTFNMVQPPATSAHFQYFIKIVPTIYTDSHNTSTHTAQYSVTTQTHQITPFDLGRADARRVPGVFFIYDLSPFMVQVSEKRVGFGSFLVSVCAIVGGVVTVIGIISSVLNWAQSRGKR